MFIYYQLWWIKMYIYSFETVFWALIVALTLCEIGAVNCSTLGININRLCNPTRRSLRSCLGGRHSQYCASIYSNGHNDDRKFPGSCGGQWSHQRPRLTARGWAVWHVVDLSDHNDRLITMTTPTKYWHSDNPICPLMTARNMNKVLCLFYEDIDRRFPAVLLRDGQPNEVAVQTAISGSF